MATLSRSLIQSLVLCGGLACSLAAPASAAPVVELVYGAGTHYPSSAKSLVPANPNFPLVGGGRFKSWDVPMFRSPTSNNWIATIGVTTAPALPAYQDQILLVGAGLTGSVIAQESVTTIDATDLYLGLSIAAQSARINDSLDWAMTIRANTATGISTAGSNEDRVIKSIGGVISTLAKSNDAAPAISGSALWGTTGNATPVFFAAGITNGGAVSFMATNIVDATTTSAGLSVDGTLATWRSGFDVPTGQISEPAVTWRDFSNNKFVKSADGSSWIAQGRLNAPAENDVAVVLNGIVVVQEGVVLANSSFTSAVSSVADAWMESNGDWYVRGANADGIDWIVRNGSLIAFEGAPIFPGSSENWTTFLDMKGNNAGHYVIIGRTNNPDTKRDDVAVVDSKRVVARESDPVDANGDGIPDAGGPFLFQFQARGFVNNDLHSYFVARMKTNASDTTGITGNDASLFRVNICIADFNNSGAVTVQDIFDFLAAWFAANPSADINDAGGITVQDIFDFLAAWFAGC